MFSISKRLSALLILFLLVGCAAMKEPVKPLKSRIKQALFADSIEANFPTDLVFFGDVLYFTEKGGTLKVLERGSKIPKTLRDFNVPSKVFYNEIGLLGIALSPAFNSNHQIYLYHSYEKDSELLNKVVRLNANKPKENPVTVIDNIKGGNIHNGGKLAFGPDGNLYIATGETGQEDLAQDKGSLNGKILRVKTDGSPVPDNPFSTESKAERENGEFNKKVYSWGHRNIFGMTFDSKGNLYVTENGPTENDEVNKIMKGGNYGWPIETGAGSGHFIKPLITYKAQIAPTGIIYYRGKRYKNLANQLVFGDYNNGDVHSLTLAGENATDKIIANSEGRINSIAQTKEGFIYIATSSEIRRFTID